MKQSTTFKYEIMYKEKTGGEYITTRGIENLEEAKKAAENMLNNPNTLSVKIAEYMTVERIIEI